MDVGDYVTENSKTGQEEGWNVDEYEDEEDDEDIDKEAQEIARRLGEQLWADITKVNAERNAAAASRAENSLQARASTPATIQEPSTAANQNRKKEDAVVTTMKSILSLVENDAQAKTMMFSTVVSNGTSVLELLYRCTSSGNIDRSIAGALSQAIILLVKSDALFGNLKQSNAPAIQLDIGKRKREAFDEGNSVHPHPQKRPYVPESDLQHQVIEAVHVISRSLGASPSQAIDPSLVSSIRLQLHQVFLFAVTSAAVAGPNMHALQEIAGLVQVIGVLSGIQIGHSPTETNTPGPSSLPGYTPGHFMATDIGTAVYPCLITGCGLTFARLYSLRAHQRSHASLRPHRCSYCPASFARNHDLKRHIKLHDRKAWKCQGCHKVFSRRDAIKRHKNGIKSRGATSDICLTAEVVEVQLEGAEAETAVREERRAKLWNDIAVNEAAGVAVGSSGHNEYRTVDDGAINPIVIMSIQTSILSLHGLLQTLVGNVLGNPTGQNIPVDSLAGQATLASVIARAQSQSSASIPSFPPPGPPGQPSMMIDAPDGLAETHSSECQGGETAQPLPSLSMYGLSDEQTRLLEVAIANAASAAQAQAEAEAALEEEEAGEENDDDDEDNEDSEMEQDKPKESQV